MDENILEAGSQENSMVRGFTKCQMELHEKQFGAMDSERDGLITNDEYIPNMSYIYLRLKLHNFSVVLIILIAIVDTFHDRQL